MTEPRAARGRHAGMVLVGLLSAALALSVWFERGQVAALERLDQWSLDLQFKARGPLLPAGKPGVLLVQVDEAGLQQLGGRVPDRSQLARVVQRLHAAGAGAVAIDLLLFAGDKNDGPGNADLATAMAQSGRVLIPFALPDRAVAPGSAASVPAVVLAQALLGYSDDNDALEASEARVYRPAALLAPSAELATVAGGLGHVSARRGSDGALRYDLPALRFEGEVYGSLALRTAVLARELDWHAVRARFGESVELGGAWRVPLDALSRQWVNFYGPAGSFEAIGFSEVLEGRFDGARVKGRVVVIGVTALAAGDHFPSPYDAGLPGVERLATVTDNILSGRSLVQAPWAATAEMGAALLLPLLAVGLLARWSMARALLGIGAVVLLGLLAVQWAFQTRYLVFSVAPTIVGVLVAVLAGSALRAAREQARRRVALSALAASEARYALAAEGANDGLWDWDIREGEVHFSPRWMALMGQDAAQAGQGIWAWTLPLDEAGRRAFDEELQAHLDGRSLRFHHVLHFTQGGQERWLLARGLAQRDGGTPVRMAGSLTDISEQQRQQRQIGFDALHDRLTGLANRVLLREQLVQLVAGDAPQDSGVLLLGLDGFRAINEARGTLAGDAVLVAIAGRLKAALGDRFLVARFGADQFALLLPGGEKASPLVTQLKALLEPPVQGADGPAFRVTAGFGWALRKHGPATADELLAAAESAMARAKSQGPGQAHEFDPAEQLVEQSRRWLREAIDTALAEGNQFELHYQPFVRLSDRELLGFEALIRWRHPTKGMVMPGDFIPLAEESGQIVAIGRWALLEAAGQLRQWQALGFTGEVAVNLSSVQLERDLELLADARATYAALGSVPAHSLKLEVTESMAMANPQRTAEVLQELARMGFKLSIDDFGTGYSSLAYLHRFPFDTLKVDRSFVVRLGAGREAQEIVRTIVGLALALGKQTLAEGVEDESQAALLEELGVQVGQGWLFAKALPADKAGALIGAGPVKPKPVPSDFKPS